MAFWSAQDNSSQVPDKQLNVVIGKVTTGGEYKLSYTNGKSRFDIKPEIIFDETALIEKEDLALFKNWMYWHNKALESRVYNVPDYSGNYGYYYKGKYYSKYEDDAWRDRYREGYKPSIEDFREHRPKGKKIQIYNKVDNTLSKYHIPKELDMYEDDFDPAIEVPVTKKESRYAWPEH